MGSSAQIPTPRHARGGNGPRVDRVAFVTGPLGDDSTGHTILRLARELRRRGKEVELLCGGGSLVGELERIGIRPVLSRQLATGGTPLWVSRKLSARLRGMEPDLIHIFGRPLAGWGPKLARCTARPYVLTVMTPAPSSRHGAIAGDWEHGAVVAVSEEIREELVNQAHIPKTAIGVIPMGIALEDYERYCDCGAREHTPVVGTVGPLVPERGCDTFLRAARQILDAGHDVVFLVAGQGPEREKLRELIRKLNIERWVTMVHHFTDYRRMIAVLDICVLPAIQEGVSLNVLEAMACRKPVVATGVGAVYDAVVDGETGFLATKQDPVAIAEKVSRLLKEPELAARIVEAAYQRVREHFSLPVSVGRLLGFYAQTLARTESA